MPAKAKTKAKYWVGDTPRMCDMCREPFTDEFSECAMYGVWGCFCPRCVRRYELSYGMGKGQRYTKQADGRWMKTAG